MLIRHIFTTVLLVGSAAITYSQTPAPTPPQTRPMIVSPTMSGQSYIGVGLCEVDAARARQLKLKEEYGVELTHVEEDSPAAKAGLKAGDVVLEYNGQRVEGMEQFARFVRETPAGRDAKVTISRDGNRQTMVVKISQRKVRETGSWAMSAPVAPAAPTPPAAPSEMGRPFMIWQSPRMGIDAEAIEGQLGEFFGVKEGVLIRSVMKGSAAEKAGLKAGDVITKVDGSTVTSPGEVTRAVRSARSKKTFPVSVMREKRETTINVTIDENDDHSERRLFFFRDGIGADGLEKFEIGPGSYHFEFQTPKEFFFDGSHIRTI